MLPTLTRDQVRRLDELAVSKYHIPSLLLMENAGRSAAAIIDRDFGPAASAFIVCGPGNNGGDGLVIARHLHNAGWNVQILLTAIADRFTPDAATNLAIVRISPIVLTEALDAASQATALANMPSDGILIDALLGTGFSGTLRLETAELIERMNATRRRAIVAIDVPSGLDCDNGRPCPVAVRADLTITFVAPKTGLLDRVAFPWVGRLTIADIGVPNALLREVHDRTP